MSAIVIVGAGPGISAAVARRFGREGFDVGLIARSPAHLDAVLTGLRDSGVEAVAQAGDAGDEVALRAAITRLSARLSTPSVLLFNAAAVRHENVLDLSIEHLITDFRIGVAGALAAVQALLAPLRAARGTVLLTGGGYAFGPDPQLMSLGIQKAAIRNLAFGLHDALKPDGVHVATATVKGGVGTTPSLAADSIAEACWEAHTMRDNREVEIG